MSMDCQGSELKDFATLVKNRMTFRNKMATPVMYMLHCTIGPTGSIMNMMMMMEFIVLNYRFLATEYEHADDDGIYCVKVALASRHIFPYAYPR